MKRFIKRYKQATIRKRRSQKEIPTPNTEVGKNQTNNQALMHENIHFCPVLFGSSKLRFIESIWLQMPVKEACLMLSLFSFETSSLLGAFLP